MFVRLKLVLLGELLDDYRLLNNEALQCILSPTLRFAV